MHVPVEQSRVTQAQDPAAGQSPVAQQRTTGLARLSPLHRSTTFAVGRLAPGETQVHDGPSLPAMAHTLLSPHGPAQRSRMHSPTAGASVGSREQSPFAAQASTAGITRLRQPSSAQQPSIGSPHDRAMHSPQAVDRSPSKPHAVPRSADGHPQRAPATATHAIRCTTARSIDRDHGNVRPTSLRDRVAVDVARPTASVGSPGSRPRRDPGEDSAS